MSKVVFLCGVRDYHAMDWFRASTQYLKPTSPIIVTDLLSSEGYPSLAHPEDRIFKLIILDRLLPGKQSKFSNIYRNILKFVLLPFQVLLLRFYLFTFKESIIYAHSMYYIWMAWLSGAKHYVATPQGSDVLIKPYRSSLYKYLSKLSLASASLITVDSSSMSSHIYDLYGLSSYVVQNGIDIKLISQTVSHSSYVPSNHSSLRIGSIRALTSLYRIDALVQARNNSSSPDIPIDFVYPFISSEYLDYIKSFTLPNDRFLGRLDRVNLYKFLASTPLIFSIPSSDSSPRSVYESIFCGSIVALQYHPFIKDLPDSMTRRLIVVDINKSDWFDSAINRYLSIIDESFIPCSRSLELFDQAHSFERVHTRLLNSIH